MKYFQFYFILFLSLALFSQKKYSKQIRLINDNDLYASFSKDRYYTNGLFLNYSNLSKNKSENLEKKIFTWQIAHQMFTPYKAIVESVIEHDRPFASYLYASFGIKRVYKNNKIFNTELQVGVIGPSASGKELQDFIHDIYDFDKAIGWKYQIKDAFGINLNATYIKHILTATSNKYDISWINNGQLGTVYTNVSSGIYGRIGLKPLQKIANSIGFNTNLNDQNTNFNREAESFLYIKPLLRYAVYDATLQGSFLNPNSLVTKELIPFVFDLEVGLKFTANRFTFGYAFRYNTNKSKNLKYYNGNRYSSISASYLVL
jgi:lipid A 3-O-deacylase